VQTEYLTTPAMTGPWESLRVNAKRGLLVADNNGSSALAIYDVSQDCSHPRLLFSGNMPSAIGHEGWFSPDGNTYWMSRLGTVVPIDISDPTHPREMGNWPAAHGGSSSDDGTRQYFCVASSPDKVLTLDSSDIQFRSPNPQPRTISSFAIPDNSACQQTYPVFYGTHPYVIQFGELAPGSFPGARCPYNPYTNFSHPRIIDMADEKNPVVASELINETELPSNCQLIQADRNATNNSGLVLVFQLFVYGTHQCTPDRLHDPTILACAEFSSGLRVYDIRDPRNPRELAYFNPGTKGFGSLTMDQAPARPVIRATRGEVWYGSQIHGFYALKFENGVYPFPTSTTCAPTYDYFFAQYNPETNCTADLSVSKTGPTKSAPTKPVTYTITTKNRGPAAADRVTIKDTLPANATFVSVSSTQGSCAAPQQQVLTCDVGTLANGDTVTVALVVKPTKRGSFTDTATAQAASAPDPVPANNTSSFTTKVG
jgi:uncharacterized repeat protein (TIGR01451 family)